MINLLRKQVCACVRYSTEVNAVLYMGVVSLSSKPQNNNMSWRKLVPLEVYPLGIFSAAVLGLAGYRCWKLSNHSEVMLTKKSAEKFAWKDEDELDALGAGQGNEQQQQQREQTVKLNEKQQ